MNVCSKSVLLITFLSLANCSLMKLGKEETAEQKAEKQKAEMPFGPSGIPPQLRSKAPSMNATIDSGSGVPASEVSVALANHPTANNIVWTDPDSDTAQLPELQKLLAAPKREVWEKSEGLAKRMAAREGKCVLIWFTDSQRSPYCKTLSKELFGKTEFGDWAKEHTIRVIVDESALAPRGEKNNEEVIAKENVDAMKKRYKAIGNPLLIVLSPKGESLGRFAGYKTGDADFLWGKLKYAVNVGESNYGDWVKSMEKRGYRQWQDRTNRKVIAKLVSYYQGKLIFVEPDGNRFKAEESNLSDSDQSWISTEKKKRNIQ
jgi:thioredoxin-related protein